jgi:hypothetical protein
MLEEVTNKALGILESKGRVFLSVLFPRDFEVYFCSLELCSYEGEMIDYFSFPILPNSINKKENYISNIKKTFGGITVIKNSDFIPQELTLRGTFGRSFKILGDKEMVNFFGSSKYKDRETYSKGTFSNIVKTGYGATRYLQGILERSKIFDGNSNKPRTLFFHNAMLGESYMVEPTQVQFDQNSASNNMMWGYSLNFTIIKTLDYGRRGGSVTFKSGNTVDVKKELGISVVTAVSGEIGKAISNSGTGLLGLGKLL